ncbi:MAG TPA: hypothetical protein GX701_03800 [Clostridiales bacterium]|jgi:phosphoribosyl 1,2-cyclic phosphate phosphodiesterase|nr:hypothetical protein [Clostridiales bacterium]
MKFQYLGTAAAEGWPALFCNCDNCEKARKAGGKNIRTRSQALIDDTLCIDIPPDTYAHILQNNLEAYKWTGLIVTHTHSDHFHSSDLTNWHPPFGLSGSFLQVYGNEGVVETVTRLLDGRDPERKRMNVTLVQHFVPFYHGKYEITPLPANHDKNQNCHIYIIEDGQSRVLYGNDTGYFPDSVWPFIEGMHFDLVSLDCTHVLDHNRHNHMSLDVCNEVKERMLASGCDEKTKFIVTHFSHNGIAIHDELLPHAEALGFDVAYDGMIINL